MINFIITFILLAIPMLWFYFNEGLLPKKLADKREREKSQRINELLKKLSDSVPQNQKE